MVRRLPAHLLRRHVTGSAHYHAGLGLLTCGECAVCGAWLRLRQLRQATGQFCGEFKIAHSATDTYFGVFNGTFVPSGQILEVHATWRITRGTGQFSGMAGAGTGKGTASVVNGSPGPGSLLLDGSVLMP